MNNTINQVLKNTVFGWIMTALSILIGIISVPIFANLFSQKEYGIWIIATQCFGYFALFDLGIRNSLSRFVASFKATHQKNEMSSYLSSSLFILITIAILLIISAIVLSFFYSQFFGIPSQYSEKVQNIVILSGIALALIFPFKIGTAYLYGNNKFSKVYVVNKVLNLLKILGLFMALIYQIKDMIFLSVIWCVLPLGLDIISYIIAKKDLEKYKMSYKLIKKKYIKDILSLCLSAFLISLSNQFTRLLIIALVGRMISLESVVLLSIPIGLILNIERFTSSFKNSFLPLASSYDALKDKKKMKFLYHYGSQINIIMSLFIGLVLWTLGYDLIELWLSSTGWQQDTLYNLWQILLILYLGYLAKSLSIIPAEIFKGTGQHWNIAISKFIFSILTFLICLIIVKYFYFHVKGFALGISIALWLEFFITYVYMLKKAKYVQFASWFYNAFLKPLFITLPIIILFYFLNLHFIDSFLTKIFFSFLFYITYGYFIFRFVIDKTMLSFLKEIKSIKLFITFFMLKKT